MSLSRPKERVSDPIAPSQPHTLWQNGNFLKFWSGETISLFGTQVTLLALPLAALLTLHVNAEQLGLLRFLENLPYVLFPLLFGVLVDRRRKQPVMILANTVRALLLALVPLLAFAHLLQLPILYGVAFCIGVFTVLFDLCSMSFVPIIVEKRHLIEANSRVAASFSAAEVGGPGLAGVIVQLFSAPLALLVDSFSYVISIITLLVIRQEEVPVSKERSHLLRDMWEGLRFSFGNPYLRTLAIQASAWNLFFYLMETAFLLYFVRELGLSPALLGVVYATSAAGGLLGSAIASRIAQRFPLGIAICCVFSLGSIPVILIPLAGGPQLWLVTIFTVAFFLVRTALAIYLVLSSSLRQAVTPLAIMGRMNASLRLVAYGGVALGPLLGGLLSGLIGLRACLWLGAIGLIIALLPIFFSPIPRLRGLPSTPE